MSFNRSKTYIGKLGTIQKKTQVHKRHIFFKGMYMLKDLLSSIREDACVGWELAVG